MPDANRLTVKFYISALARLPLSKSVPASSYPCSVEKRENDAVGVQDLPALNTTGLVFRATRRSQQFILDDLRN